MAMVKTSVEKKNSKAEEEFKNTFYAILYDFINRNKINKIICTSSKIIIEKLSFSDVDITLKNPRERIFVNSANFLNDKTNIDNVKETDEINEHYTLTIKSINELIDKFKKEFVDEYFLNETMSAAFKLLDYEIENIEFYKWLNEKDVRNKNKYLYLQIDKKRKPYSDLQLDFTFLLPFITEAFLARKINLDKLKNFLLKNQFNYYLPSVDNLPVFERSVSLPELCILIESFSFFVNNSDQQKFKKMMKNLFSIKDKTFTSSLSEFRSNKKISEDMKSLIRTLIMKKQIDQ